MVRRIFGWNDGSLCYWYRLKIPLERLAQGGHWQVTCGRVLPPDIHRYDVVVGQRIVGANPAWLALCKNPNLLAVYDMDDDLVNFGVENERGYAYYAQHADETRRNVSAADVVTVCTPHVAENMRTINRNVHELPICIPADVIDFPLHRRRESQWTIGWAGTPYHGHDWVEVQAPLAEFARRAPNAMFHAMGADYTRDAFPGRTRVTGFQPYASYYKAVDFDVGLAPLVKSDFNRGKSHTKPLEYGARGAPSIVTAWGQYTDWVRPGINGFLVEEPSEWLEALMALSDERVRATMSDAARESARAFTIDRHIHKWERAYSGAMAA